MSDHDIIGNRLTGGRAWEDFCDQLKAAGRLIDGFGADPGPGDRAEFYRFLTRLIRNGCERFMENCEFGRPRLRDASWRSSINFQSPDQDHLMCEFDPPAGAYRIRGHRGTVPYFIIAAWDAPLPPDLAARDWSVAGTAGLAEFDVTRLKTSAFLPSQRIDFDADGNFEVIVGGPEGPRNWMPLTEEACGLLIRVVHLDRASETNPVVTIERVDGAPPRPVTAEDVARGLAKSAQEVIGYVELARLWWRERLADLPNAIRFDQSLYLSNGGVADRHFGFGTWALAPDEALLLRFRPPACEHWNFQLCTMWQENLDCYEEGAGYITKSRVHVADDGWVTIVISEAALDVPNHVPTWGHRLGTMGLRLIGTTMVPELDFQMMPAADVQAHLRGS